MFPFSFYVENYSNISLNAHWICCDASERTLIHFLTERLQIVRNHLKSNNNNNTDNPISTWHIVSWKNLIQLRLSQWERGLCFEYRSFRFIAWFNFDLAFIRVFFWAFERARAEDNLQNKGVTEERLHFFGETTNERVKSSSENELNWSEPDAHDYSLIGRFKTGALARTFQIKPDTINEEAWTLTILV